MRTTNRAIFLVFLSFYHKPLLQWGWKYEWRNTVHTHAVCGKWFVNKGGAWNGNEWILAANCRHLVLYKGGENTSEVSRISYLKLWHSVRLMSQRRITAQALQRPECCARFLWWCTQSRVWLNVGNASCHSYALSPSVQELCQPTQAARLL